MRNSVSSRIRSIASSDCFSLVFYCFAGLFYCITINPRGKIPTVPWRSRIHIDPNRSSASPFWSPFALHRRTRVFFEIPYRSARTVRCLHPNEAAPRTPPPSATASYGWRLQHRAKSPVLHPNRGECAKEPFSMYRKNRLDTAGSAPQALHCC